MKNAKADPGAKLPYLNLPHLVQEKMLKLKIIGLEALKWLYFIEFGTVMLKHFRMLITPPIKLLKFGRFLLQYNTSSP